MFITDAKNKTLFQNPGNLPNMSEEITEWFQKLTFVKISKSVVNHEVLEDLKPRSFMGVRQPLTPQQLEMKPEGQRRWRWEQIHALPDLVLQPDDVIRFGKIPYRVMSKSDFKEYGYVEYHIVEDYR